MPLDSPVPISTTLQKSYRDTMQTPTAPAFLDPTLPIQPVAVIANTSTAASSVSITDGTDTATVTTGGYLNVAPQFEQPSSAQTIVNYSTGKNGQSITSNTGYTARSVTATKTFYMTYVMVVGSAGPWQSEFYDGAVSGTPKYICRQGVADNAHIAVFPTPIAFTTDVQIDVRNTGTYEISFGGFEA